MAPGKTGRGSELGLLTEHGKGAGSSPTSKPTLNVVKIDGVIQGLPLSEVLMS